MKFKNTTYLKAWLRNVKCSNNFLLILSSNRTNLMIQETRNPSVYTKLSCFLPWIAEQHNMIFENKIEDENQECSEGNGDINDFDAGECRCNCPGEDLCIFPYYWNGKLIEQCALLEEEEFRFPIFRCPIRNITRKINGINSFILSDFIKQVKIQYQ